MKKWQRMWLFGVAAFFSLHILRDILQDLGISTPISSVFVKTWPSGVPGWYWSVFNTYVIAAIQLVLSFAALKKNRFYPWGSLTIVVASTFLVVWLIYWFS